MKDRIAIVKATTKELLDRLKTKAEIMVTETADDIKVDIIADDSSLIIGVKGQNLYSLEHLVRVLANKQLDEFVYINVDVAGYKDKRRQMIEQMVAKAIEKVQGSNSPIELDLMNSGERKIVHNLCQPVDGITSESNGVGENRRVVIKPS